MAQSRGTRPPVSIWLAPRSKPVRKTAPTALDRDRIVETAMRLLDAEGLAKFSMRRLAAELGVSAMSVYWYVDSKDDLLELVLDAVSGEIELPALTEYGDWRTDLRRIAYEFRRVLLAHPWATHLIGEYLNIGPNFMAVSTAAQRILTRTGLPRELVPGALTTVMQFVHGYGALECRWSSGCAEAGVDPDDVHRRFVDQVRGRPEFAYQLEWLEKRSAMGIKAAREDDFAFALDCVIAGIDAMSGQRSKG